MLSADNFFWRIDLENGVMTRIAKWRELDRPEAALLGVQYIGNDEGEHRGPWLLREAPSTNWLFAKTGVTVGQGFSNAGIEIDHTNSHSPRGTQVLGELPNLLGPGMTGQMDLLLDESRRPGLLGRRLHASQARSARGRLPSCWRTSGTGSSAPRPRPLPSPPRTETPHTPARGTTRCPRAGPRPAATMTSHAPADGKALGGAPHSSSRCSPCLRDRPGRPPSRSAPTEPAPRLLGLRAYTRSPQKYAGDRRLLVTISPNGDRVRDVAKIGFTLTERATVRLRIARTVSGPVTVYEKTATLGPGRHAFSWFPEPTIAPRTYLTLLDVTDASNNRRTYGASNAETGRRPTAPVIRVLGVDAGFTRESYVPGETATLRVETDANALSLQVFRAGPEDVPTYNDTLMNGEPMTEPVNVVWSSPDRPGAVSVQIGEWASGVYFARLTADDGRIGFAPFVLRPAQLGATRVAVIIPTNTWQAYNFRDEDGNGWGNTWYAKGAGSTVKLGRPFLRRGVPPQYRKYDLGFLRWLAQRGKQPDYLTETDLEVLNGDALAGRYDLVIFGGHTEYVTPREFGAIERYRDLGGNLMFLSADNFFWQVQRRGDVLSRTRKWRDLGRPESALLGVQYRANDNGRQQRPFIVRAADTVPWLFAGTDLSNGASLGQELGGYGIEIDMTTPASPPGTTVLAEIPDLFGPGFTAQMTYYETPAGAKVFAAGAIDFGGTALLPAVSRMLENLWARLSVP